MDEGRPLLLELRLTEASEGSETLHRRLTERGDRPKGAIVSSALTADCSEQ